MDALQQNHWLINETRIDLLENDLVLITRKEHNNVTSLEDLTKETVHRICIGIPMYVPIGWSICAGVLIAA